MSHTNPATHAVELGNVTGGVNFKTTYDRQPRQLSSATGGTVTIVAQDGGASVDVVIAANGSLPQPCFLESVTSTVSDLIAWF